MKHPSQALPPPDYNSPSALRAFLEERGLSARKRYGQNFLIMPDARERLLDALECGAGSHVWEVGPGLGAMTAGLLSRGIRVTAFEIDPAFSDILESLFGGDSNFTLLRGDAFKTWPAAAAGDGGGPGLGPGLGPRLGPGRGPRPCLLGNLPYSVGAALLGDFIEKGMRFPRMAVTLQREAARRMTARPGDGDYSSFSVLCASAYRAAPLMTLKGSAFYPAPRVDSQAMRLDLREDAPPLPLCFYPLVRALFASRRKTLKNNLAAFLASQGPDAVDLAYGVLSEVNIEGDRRAETLALEDFAAIAWAVNGLPRRR